MLNMANMRYRIVNKLESSETTSLDKVKLDILHSCLSQSLVCAHVERLFYGKKQGVRRTC